MSMQDEFERMMKAERKKQMETSPQKTLGEIISLLEEIKKPRTHILVSSFDNTEQEIIRLSSWRGSYNELAIEYDCDEKAFTAGRFLTLCKKAVGKKYRGYKGGIFIMSKKTPVWIANWGNCNSVRDGYCGVVDIIHKDKKVIIVGKECPYL